MGQNKREILEADIQRLDAEIHDFNGHWLNHRHIMSACGVVVMALIFTGMLVPSVELYLWGLCGVIILAFIGAMIWRSREADRLNGEIEAAHKAFKEYERGRRKK